MDDSTRLQDTLELLSCFELRSLDAKKMLVRAFVIAFFVSPRRVGEGQTTKPPPASCFQPKPFHSGTPHKLPLKVILS